MLDGLIQPALLLADSKRFASQIYLWLGVIIALVFVLGVVALWLRRRLLDQPDDQPLAGFTLTDLREMHAQGHLSDEELAAAEEKALARSRSHYLGHAVAPLEEPEDIGHLSTGSEEDFDGGTENVAGSSDKNPDGEPGP